VAGLEVPSLVDALEKALREEVLSGRLPPGSTVTAPEIAHRWDVARPTARAAIDRVVASGILRRSANKSARVPLLSDDDVTDLYVSRIAFERNVVRALAAKRSVPDAAIGALDEMKAAIATDSILDAAAGDIKIHRALVDGMGSPRLARMFATVAEEVHLCMAQEQQGGELSRESNYDEHRGIADAIGAADADLAERLIIEHLRSAMERLVGVREGVSHWYW
jgi:DNA-binding GntR family transcriptional regulator